MHFYLTVIFFPKKHLNTFSDCFKLLKEMKWGKKKKLQCNFSLSEKLNFGAHAWFLCPKG